MKIIGISGSIRKGSTTVQFLEAISDYMVDYEIELYDIGKLSPFHPDAYESIIDPEVVHFKQKLNETDAIIIATPEYIYGIPAILKNALEWTTQSGEFYGKKVIALTYTPHPPRGEKALRNLLDSLKALKANVLLGESLYHDIFDDKGELNGDQLELLEGIFELLG